MSAYSQGHSVKRRIPTLVIEQSALLREGIVSLLQDTQYKVVASVGVPSELRNVSMLGTTHSLVILGLPDGTSNIVQTVGRIRPSFPSAKFVIVAERRVGLDLHELMQAGAGSLVLSVSSREVFLKALDLTFLNQHLVVVGRPFSGFQDVEMEHVTLVPNQVQGLVLSDDSNACMKPTFRQ